MAHDEGGSHPPPRLYEAAGGTLEVGHAASGIAIVTVHGEHDLSSEAALRDAFDYAAAHSSVVIDLSDCSFMDSTVIAALLRTARSVQSKGDGFAIVIPSAQRQLARIAEMTGLEDVISVHTSQDAAVASLHRAGEGA